MASEQELLREIVAHLRGLREIADVIKTDLERLTTVLELIEERTRPEPPPGRPRQ